jgi:hypothetical protein
MTVIVRDFRREDAPSVVRVRRAALPYLVTTAEAVLCSDAFTSNDAGNGPMLAVNKWFGYEICASEVRHVRTLG